MPGRLRTMLAVICAGLASTVSVAADGSATTDPLPDPGTPLAVRNLSPAAALFGLPRARGALAPDGVAVGLLLEHANNFTADAGADAAVFLDGSTTVASVVVRGGVGGRWEWGAELPWVHHSGGIMDGFIEGFHDLFGLPGGGREHAPRDRLTYRVDHLGRRLATVAEAGGRPGDVRGWLGYRPGHSPARDVLVRAMVKAPTGRVGDLSGSEGTDVSLAIELVDRALLEAVPVTVTLMGAVTALGEGEFAEPDRAELVYSGHLGLNYPLTPGLVLRAQLDGHTDIVDTSIRQLAHGTLQGTLGGTLALSSRGWLDLGVIEDLTGESAPDVVFLLSVGMRL